PCSARSAIHVPPVVRTGSPTSGSFSTTSTLLPASATTRAALRPAGPPPTTTTSNRGPSILLSGYSDGASGLQGRRILPEHVTGRSRPRILRSPTRRWRSLARAAAPPQVDGGPASSGTDG